MLPKIAPRDNDQRFQHAYNDLLRYEARLGGQLFGPVSKGRRREFFCLDRRTWVWHEEWIDQSGSRRVVSTHYQVRPDGILKTQDNQNYHRLTIDEERNFRHAVRLYVERIPTALRQRMQMAS
jgi:hypothetical protein